MCMGTPISKTGLKQLKAEARKRGYIRIYKVVKKGSDSFPKWSSPFGYGFYKPGIQAADKDRSGPIFCQSGWHGFRDRKSATRFGYGNETVLSCLALSDWIIDAGKDTISCTHFVTLKTIRLTTLCFPKYPKQVVTLREFKRQLKG